jgi:malate synthase
VGAVAIDNLMEDAATAEISRSQLWQWIAAGSTLGNGGRVDSALVRETIGSVVGELSASEAPGPRLDEAREVFQVVALPPNFAEFLTLPAYELLD